ncbi:MAG: hypothetical protein ABIJ81_02095 [Patescibacteria group bacterium]
MAEAVKWMNLKDSNNLQIWQDTLSYFALYNSTHEIKEYHDSLNILLESHPTLNKEFPTLYTEYEKLLYRSKFLILPLLKFSEIYNLFEEHIVVALSFSYLDIWEQVNIVLVSTLTLEERNKIRNELSQSLISNREVLVSKVNNITQSTTVGEFVKKSLEQFGNKPMNTIQQNEFLVRETKLFGDTDKVAARKLVQLFEKLKLSSFDLKGFEQPIPVNDGKHYGVIKSGVFEPYTVSQDERDKLKLAIELVSGKKMKGGALPTAKSEKKSETKAKEFITHTPTALKTADPAFFFDLQDEEEVEKFRSKNLEAGIVGTTLEANLRQLAEEIITEHNFQFKDETSRRRLVQLFVSFMKDVRDQIEAKEVLLRSVETGGLGLTLDKAEAVIKIFTKVKESLPNKIKEFSKLVDQKPSVKVPIPVVQPVVPPPPPPAVKVKKPVTDQVAEWRREMLEEIAKTGITPTKSQPQPKPKLTDVKAKPKVYGPLEELKEMSLVDFRRLGDSASAVTSKLLAKIQLIGETGIGRRLAAVRAWQASAVYQIYLEIGRASIEQGKAVTDVISELQAESQETLTVAEFEAIVDLNQKLRF